MVVPGISQAARKPDIVLVTLGSTRSDRMGFLGAKTKTSPNLDSLAGQSMVFEQAFSQAPLTVVSHATSFWNLSSNESRQRIWRRAFRNSSPYSRICSTFALFRTAALVGSIALDPKNRIDPCFDRGFSTYDAGF